MVSTKPRHSETSLRSDCNGGGCDCVIEYDIKGQRRRWWVSKSYHFTMTTHYDANALSLYSFPPGTRNARLPKIYIAQNHPLHPLSNPGNTYIVKIRPTAAAMEEAEQFEKSLGIPQGQKEQLDKQGALMLSYPRIRADAMRTRVT